MRNKLLGYLYGAFDRDPDAATVMTLTHPDGVTWSVAGRRLVVNTETDAPLADIDLSSGTVLQAAVQLAQVGVGVRLKSAFSGLSALVLVDGAGTESVFTNVVRGHRSVLWALMDSYATEVQAAADSVPQALAQARMHTADGYWLDFWGSYFNVVRRPSQNDSDYLAWIVAETLRKKSNKYAIESAIIATTGSQTVITEPWQSIFRLDVSQLSGSHALHDGVVAGYHLIRPRIPASSDWDGVMAVIEDTRAAGVMVSNPVRVIPPFYSTSTGYAGLWSSRFVENTFFTGRSTCDVLGALVLDGYRPPLNYPVSFYTMMVLECATDVNINQHITPYRSRSKASVTLSDGFALGEANAILGRGIRKVKNIPVSDGLTLSGTQVLSGLFGASTNVLRWTGGWSGSTWDMGAREREILCITDITIAQHGFDANLVTVPVQSWQTWGDQSLRVNKRHLAALDGLVLDGVISV
jgi:hypothetical protein